MKMITKKITMVCLLAPALLLNGCAENKIPEMSREEEALVVEYAAMTLLKYDTEYVEKLVELPEEEQMVNEQLSEEQQPPMEKPDALPEEPEAGSGRMDGQGNHDITEENSSQTLSSAETVLGLHEVSLTYTGYEVDEFYPKNGNEIYFMMNATDGCQLLVLKFDLKNLSEQEQEISITPGAVRIKIVLNGSEKNALTTMLLNDMATYQGTLAPEESTELVVVGEYKNEELQEISSLQLKLKSDSEETIIDAQ